MIDMYSDGGQCAAPHERFRPAYPSDVGAIISSYMETQCCSGYINAIDVCCGSGQGTILLSSIFKTVVGYDKSQAQIARANEKHRNIIGVSFEIGDAHNLPVESSSVDLVTCAMGWHWLEPEKFYSEAKRILKPRGCIAVYGYNANVSDNDLVSKITETFTRELITNGCLDQRLYHMFNEYRDVTLPFSNVERVKFDVPQRATLKQLLRTFESITSYQEYCKKFSRNDFLEKLQEKYEGEWLGNSLQFNYPGFMVLGVNM